MFFGSIKGINRLISKEISNIYIKVTIQKNWRSQSFDYLKFFSKIVFGELQLMQISLNFKTSYCNLKVRGLWAKLCVAFLLC